MWWSLDRVRQTSPAAGKTFSTVRIELALDDFQGAYVAVLIARIQAAVGQSHD